MIESQAQSRPLSTAALLTSALLVSLGAAVGQGFARFGYALLLTPMRDSLHWTYAQAGLINSANALGYLFGSLAVGPFVARWGAPRIVRLSLLAVSCSLITTGLLDGFGWLMLSRIVSGAAAGLLFIAGVSVVMTLAPAGRSDLPIGVYYGGPGIGIALSGLLVPVALGALAWNWRAVWIALGVLGLLIQLLVEVPLRAARAAQPPRGRASNQRLVVWDDFVRIWPALLAYTLYGLGYIGYMTFVVAFLRSINVAPGLVQLFWVLLGVCAAATGFLWRPLIRSLQPRHALFAVLATLAIGAVLPVLVTRTWSFMLSAILFGGTFLSVVTIVTLQVRAALPPTRWVAMVGNATSLFALGQLIGPTVTGLVADLHSGLALGLLGSAAVLALGAAIALFRPPLSLAEGTDREPGAARAER